MHKIFTFCCLLFVVSGFAQSGKITGKVISSRTGDVLAGATVMLAKPPRKVVTDQAGLYNIGGLAAGTYTVTVTYVGYQTKEVSDIVVKDKEVTEINISADPKESSLENVVITRTRATRETQGALLITQKNAAVVSDGISAELIRRTPDRATSDVLKRISGVSIQDNKFAVVRGLNDRYNAAYLNGAPLPSSENDRKAFAFDIFPANMLENLVILKTASPDMPGEFAGGVINISTSSIPAKTFTSISVGTGYNSITTYKNGKTYAGGSSDWLGLDDGTRAIPKGVPATANFPIVAAQRAELAKLYTNNNWGITNRNVPMNYNFQLTQGLNIPRKGTEFFGALISLTYNKTYAFSGGELNTYEYNRANPAAPPEQRAGFPSVENHSEQTLAGLVANFSFKLNNSNKISLKNIVSINADDRVIIFTGKPDVPGDPEFNVSARGLWYTSNVITSSQLFGEHSIGKAKIKATWLLSYGQVDRKIPNLRQLNYGYNDGQNNYTAGIASSTISSDNSGSMFHSKTNERIYSAKSDFSKNFDGGDNFKTAVSAGGYFQYRDRSFDARLLGFAAYRGGTGFDNSLLSLPQENIFAPSNMGIMANGKGGFLLLDGTNPTFAYGANSTLYAAYLMADSRFGKKFRAIYGVRYENFNQQLNSFRDFTNELKLNTSKADFLPSVNLVFSASPKQNIRFSYSRTLNRPEFRELAPFAFFDFSNRIVVGGNPDLVRASINNYDVRYELYPGKGQLVSVSGFLKDFKNPVELTSDPNNFNSTAFQNAVSGKNYGIELEFRTLLSTLFGNEASPVLGRLTVAANGSYIFSNVREADFAGVVKGVENRPLQGQSPYLFNASIGYNDNDHGWSATISANRVGQRIFIVGSLNEPDTWEQGRTLVDLQLSKTLLKDKMEIKLNCRDLLRQKQVFFLDLNESKSYNKGTDPVFYSRTFGTVTSLSVSYKF